MASAVAARQCRGDCGAGGDVLTSWAENLSGRAGKRARGVLRFVFYGRVSTEDWQDPVTSRARQREQAGALVRGHGQIVADFFDVGQTRKLAWACRPQSAALVAHLVGPGGGGVGSDRDRGVRA